MHGSLKILWRGSNAIAVEKPAGLATQAALPNESVESCLREQLESKYVAMVHRLDRPVTGVLLVATTKAAARVLSEQFAARRVQKMYVGCVEGRFPIGEPCVWKDWIRKVPDQAKAEICGADDDGAREAESAVTGLEYDPEIDRSLVQFSPKTGRMHQLRLQASRREFPIVGDQLYGSTSPPLKSGRGEQILLHAASLIFYDPKTCKQVTVSSTVPFASNGMLHGE